MVMQAIDGISFKLKEPHDFSFLSRYGKVFRVFDQNDSGNISFGVSDGKHRYFIKVAGAETAEARTESGKVISLLKNAVNLYKALKHPNLTELIEHYEAGGSYVAVFKWAEGECLFDHWNFDKYSKNPDLLPPVSRFRQLPVEKKLKSIKYDI